jgi:hypothetical protein
VCHRPTLGTLGDSLAGPISHGGQRNLLGPLRLPDRVGNELTGILSGTGAKMKAEVLEDAVSFRGAIKAEVPFEELVAEARGSLLILSYQGQTIELGAGARAAQLASKIRTPPSRLERLGIDYGITAAVAGPITGDFRAELAARAIVVPGVPREPVQILVFGVEQLGHLESLSKLTPLVAPGGCLWLIAQSATVPAAKIAAAAKAAGLTVATTARFSPTQVATKLVRP